MKKFFYDVAINRPLAQLYTYEGPQLVKIGSRVRILFGKKEILGIVVKRTSQPAFKTNPIIRILDNEPLFSKHQLKLLNWSADYYKYPMGEVIHAFIPAYLKKMEGQHPFEKESIGNFLIHEPTLLLSNEQQKALKDIQALDSFNVHVLQGVTGSGKTEVYLQAIEKMLRNDKSVLVLVPEISLVPQTLKRFRDRFGNVCYAYHSAMTPKERMKVWNSAANGAARVIIGTRSSILLPIKNPGMFIIDEEHDKSYKQHEGFRFSARDLLIKRAQMLDIPILLGSATPSFQTIRSINDSRYSVSYLKERITSGNPPSFTIIDMALSKLEAGLSQQAFDAIERVLKQKRQALIFLNRRGYAPKFLCSECGWIAQCNNCESNLVFHQLEKRMICHRCESKYAIPKHCPACNEISLIMTGEGTEKIEHVLEARFFDTKIIRVDRDTTRKVGSMQNLMEEINQNQKSILIGTKMLTKGHHFPNLALVVIVNLDQSLISLDPFALEDLGQQIIQVAGRAGRENTPAEVLLQTSYPNHPLLGVLKNGKYDIFAKTILEDRERSKLPPYSYQAVIRCHSRSIKKNMDALNSLASIEFKEAEIFGPMPAVTAKKGGNYFHQIIIQALSRNKLSQNLDVVLRNIQTAKRTVKWTWDIDPVEH